MRTCEDQVTNMKNHRCINFKQAKYSVVVLVAERTVRNSHNLMALGSQHRLNADHEELADVLVVFKQSLILNNSLKIMISIA